MFTLDPSTSFFPQVLIKTAESKSGFRLQLLYYARGEAKHCDWNQAPGCRRKTPHIEEKKNKDKGEILVPFQLLDAVAPSKKKKKKKKKKNGLIGRK